MTAGSEVINVLTAGAPPNSSIILRIDNRTTVTITVNADQVPPGYCAPDIVGGPGTIPGLVPETPPGQGTAPQPLQGAGGVFEVPYWASLWAGGGGSGGPGGSGTGIGGSGGTGGGGGSTGGGGTGGGSGTGGEGTGGGGSGTGGEGTGGGGSGTGGGTGTGGGGGGYQGGGGAGIQTGSQATFEPSTLALLTSGVVGLLFLARRRR